MTIESREAAAKLLGWLAKGEAEDLVVRRVACWFSRGKDDPDFKRVTSYLLRHLHDLERKKRWAAGLLDVTPSSEIENLVIDSMEPRWFSGSEKVAYTSIANGLKSWIDDSDPKIAALGRRAAKYFRGLASRSDGADEDPDAEWGTE